MKNMPTLLLLSPCVCVCTICTLCSVLLLCLFVVVFFLLAAYSQHDDMMVHGSLKEEEEKVFGRYGNISKLRGSTTSVFREKSRPNPYCLLLVFVSDVEMVLRMREILELSTRVYKEKKEYSSFVVL